MKNTHRITVVCLCVAAAALSQASFLDWQLNGRGGRITSGQNLTLYNITDKENLKYGSRTWGINLVWDKTPDLHNVSIHGRGSVGRPLNYTERVAIYIRGGGYLKHEKRTVGINLGWSSTPVYEWEIGGSGGNPGQPMNQGDSLCLYNTVAKDFVIYDVRRAGINLVWAKDKGTRGWNSLLTDTLRALGSPSTKMSNWISGLGR